MLKNLFYFSLLLSCQYVQVLRAAWRLLLIGVPYGSALPVSLLPSVRLFRASSRLSSGFRGFLPRRDAAIFTIAQFLFIAVLFHSSHGSGTPPRPQALAFRSPLFGPFRTRHSPASTQYPAPSGTDFPPPFRRRRTISSGNEIHSATNHGGCFTPSANHARASVSRKGDAGQFPQAGAGRRFPPLRNLPALSFTGGRGTLGPVVARRW
jgi:hypothetical protein